MTRIPSKDEILAWISDNPTLTAKRDIARAFGIKGAARIELKRILREMEDAGHLEKRKKTYRDPERLPPVSVLQVIGPDSDGDLWAKPLEWSGEGAEPRILIVPRDGDPALGAGDRVLARLTEVAGDLARYDGRLIRRIGASPSRVLGVFRKTAEGGRIVPVDKGADREWLVPSGATLQARDGELVEAEAMGPRARLGLPTARIVTRLGDPSGPRAVSLIAIHQFGIPDDFDPAALAEAEAAQDPGPEGREDLTGLPLLTIDPADARDHDDAVCAETDPDVGNPGGFVLWVAIADVAAQVRPGTALDRDARLRGNSTYFPDRVVPMLPERLSGDLCSLHEGVDRSVIAVRMRIDAEGRKIDHRFHRGIMRSRASLTYDEAQATADGRPTARTEPLVPVIQTLFAAYRALMRARDRRQPLDLDLPERRIELDADGSVTSVAFRDRLDAHRLIEEFMVLANVAAAEELMARRTPLVFRVHEEPAPEKLEALREVAQASGLVLAKGQVLKTAHLNRLLAQAEGTDADELINIATLRSMQQAYYTPENFGHFGLALRAYAHFTSPIRRYADLVVHRALISAHRWGTDGLSAAETDTLDATAKHISETERRSMAAERDTVDRYLAAWLADRVGAEFEGRISGIQRFGAFVKLDESGADGMIPIRTIGREFFHYDARTQTLMGADTGLTLTVGQRVLVRLAEATPVTGGIMLELLEVQGNALPAGGRPARNGPVGRRGARERAGRTAAARKVVRRRK